MKCVSDSASKVFCRTIEANDGAEGFHNGLIRLVNGGSYARERHIRTLAALLVMIATSGWDVALTMAQDQTGSHAAGAVILARAGTSRAAAPSIRIPSASNTAKRSGSQGCQFVGMARAATLALAESRLMQFL
jgi:hypothetical protein